MPAFRSSRLERKSRRRVLSFKRLALQHLEHRLVLSAVAWTGASGGSWDVASNWSTDAVPGPSDDVTIDTSAAMTITIGSGDNITVDSLTTGANDTLSITGGSVTVSGGTSTLAGPLTMTGGSLAASGSGTAFTANGATSISAASLYAESGGTLSLPELATYASNSTALEANGSGSVLNLPALASVIHDGSLEINAASGGKIELGSLHSLTGSSNPGDLKLNDTGNSTLVDPNLVSLDFVAATLDGSDTQAVSPWKTYTDGVLNVTGGTLSATLLVDTDGTDLSLSGGAALTMPVLAIGPSHTASLSGNASLDTMGDLTNNGALSVDAGSKVSVGGDFTQGSNAALNVQIGGSSASGRFGQVVVKNAATLAGTLNLSFANGYTPQTGDDFRIMTFANAINNFATVTGLGVSLTEKLQPTSVELSGPPLDAVQSPDGTTLNATIGDGFYDTVATFTDSNPAAQASQFVVAIDWGDGTINGGNVGGNGGQFQAQGSHDYAHNGTFTVTTTIVDHGVATVVTSTAVVLPWANGRINVTTSADTPAANPANSPEDSAGNISLRSAIEYLNTTGQTNDTIAFDGNYFRGPLQLTLGPLEIDASVTIDGGNVYQLTIKPGAADGSQFFKIDKLDANNSPVAVTLSNLTFDLGPLAPNNAAAIENLGSVTLDNVNFASSIGYSPASGDTAVFISGSGQLTGPAKINGAVVSPTDDTGLSSNGNVYPFKVNYSSDGLSLTFDTTPTIGPSGGNVTVGQSVPVPAADVVADWRFQEGTAGQPATGAILDSSGHGLDGTPINSPVYSSNVPYSTVPQTGQPDKVSLQFNGTNQQVVVPDNPAFQLTHSLTIEAVVYVPAAAQYAFGFVLFRGDYRPGLDPYWLSIGGSGTNLSASFNIEDASNNGAGISASLPGVNQWLDVVGTLDDA
ncbi:MAG: beta strand repeat-containing protein, partial [Pirellulales bacterium]